MQQKTTEPYSPWQNKAEAEIRELKKHYRRVMNKSRAPEVLWCYCLEYVAAIRAMTSRPILADRTPYENLTGETPDISEYIEFEFHGMVIYGIACCNWYILDLFKRIMKATHIHHLTCIVEHFPTLATTNSISS